MNNCCFCIYTHSSYNVLEPLVYYTLQHVITSMPVYIFSDRETAYAATPRLKKVLKYNDSLPYAQKVLSCIEQIDEPYMILIQEKDLVFMFDEKKIQDILECMNDYSISTVDLHINQYLYNPFQGELITESERAIFPTNFKNPALAEAVTFSYKSVKLSRSLEYHYSCGPRIWNLSKLKHILVNFPEKTYRTIESAEVDNFMNDNGLLSVKLSLSGDDTLVFAGKGSKMVNYFAWLSVTNFRKIVEEYYWQDLTIHMKKALVEVGIAKEDFLKIQLE